MGKTLSMLKTSVKNLRRDKPKGFKDLKELDKFLKNNKIEVQDPFRYTVRFHFITEYLES